MRPSNILLTQPDAAGTRGILVDYFGSSCVDVRASVTPDDNPISTRWLPPRVTADRRPAEAEHAAARTRAGPGAREGARRGTATDSTARAAFGRRWRAHCPARTAGVPP